MSHTNVSCTQFFPLTHKFLYAEKTILYANDIAHHQWRARNNNHDMKKKKKKKQHSLCVTPISLPIIHLFYHKDILKSRSINTTSYLKKNKIDLGLIITPLEHWKLGLTICIYILSIKAIHAIKRHL
jgi:hypothetical protein